MFLRESEPTHEVILTGASALRAIRKARIGKEFALVPCEKHTVSPCNPHDLPGEVLTFIRGFESEGKVHIRVPYKAKRFKSQGFVLHETPTGLPDHAFYRLVPTGGSRYSLASAIGAAMGGPGGSSSITIYVDMPTLVLPWLAYQLQRHMNTGKLTYNQVLMRTAALAMEFCGCYSLEPDGMGCGKGMYFLAPLLSKEQLCSMLENARKTKGIVIARKAARLAADNAASPPEALMYLLLSAPIRRGGLGYPDVRLNEPVDPEELRQGNATHRRLTPDLYLAGLHVAFDFHGRFAHEVYCDDDIDAVVEEMFGDDGRRDQYREDIVRLQDLLLAHISVFPVTMEDLANSLKFAELARKFSVAIDRWCAGTKRANESGRVSLLVAKADWQRTANEIINAFQPHRWARGIV